MNNKRGGFGDFEDVARAIGDQLKAATSGKGSFDKGDFEEFARSLGEQFRGFGGLGGLGRGPGGPGGPGFGPGGPRGRHGGRGPGSRGFGPGGPGGPRGRGGRGGMRGPDVPSAEDAASWFAGRLPDAWFTGTAEVSVDRDEIVVVGTIEVPAHSGDATAADVAAAESGRIARFREDTRDERIAIAQQAEHRYQRKIAWGAQAGDTRELFSVANVPVMTRLQQPERQVLDTLVDAGVARSRSEALAWCVRLVGDNVGDWLDELRNALGAVDEVRNSGPTITAPYGESDSDEAKDDAADGTDGAVQPGDEE